MAQHKLTLILMTGSLLSGLALAIGHHLFYNYLNNRIVQSQNQQEWFLRIGTGMAFLVRASLSAAIGIAYVQILWKKLRSKSITINGIDSLFGVLHNAWGLTTFELWAAAPALTIIAIIAWLLPLIAVITPATLSIEISPQQNITVIESLIPNIDYDRTLWFGNWWQNRTVGHAAHISRLLLPVATLGSILNIPAPFPNSSYSVEFYGPSISCETPESAAFTDLITKTIANASGIEEIVTYVGFVPWRPDSYESSRTTPFDITTREDFAIKGLKLAMDYTQIQFAPTLDTTANEMEPELGQYNTASFYVTTSSKRAGQAENTIQCQLYNSSYTVNFTFDNGLQDITYEIERLNGVNALAAKECRLGKILHHCNPVTAYLALMNAMGDLILGSHWNNDRNGADSSLRTMIGSTTLIDSPDMHAFYFKEKPKSPIKPMSMGDTLEELFTNVTISLFSDSQFLQNDTTASYGPITQFSAQNAFSYEPRNLFIAYGIGMLLSIIIIIYGLLCIKSTSASYSHSFSTILRTTRNPDLDAVIPAAETSGAEPLSKNIGNIRLILRRQRSGLEVGGDEAMFFAVDPKSDDGKEIREAAPTDSLLKQNMRSQHSDTDEISTTQESPDANLHYKKDNPTVVTSDN